MAGLKVYQYPVPYSTVEAVERRSGVRAISFSDMALSAIGLGWGMRSGWGWLPGTHGNPVWVVKDVNMPGRGKDYYVSRYIMTGTNSGNSLSVRRCSDTVWEYTSWEYCTYSPNRLRLVADQGAVSDSLWSFDRRDFGPPSRPTFILYNPYGNRLTFRARFACLLSDGEPQNGQEAVIQEEIAKVRNADAARGLDMEAQIRKEAEHPSNSGFAGWAKGDPEDIRDSFFHRAPSTRCPECDEKAKASRKQAFSKVQTYMKDETARVEVDPGLTRRVHHAGQGRSAEWRGGNENDWWEEETVIRPKYADQPTGRRFSVTEQLAGVMYYYECSHGHKWCDYQDQPTYELSRTKPA